VETRRETLKIIGAIGTTCAFPFSADELYGQHVHGVPAIKKDREPFTPKFFTPSEFETVSRIADLIIPPTETPGAVGAGVPQYIDYVVNANTEHQNIYRAGLEWLDRHSMELFGQNFRQATEAQQVELLTPLSEAVDDDDDVDDPGEKFFQAIKKMTADGYYTSQIGLVQELGYAGNTVLSQFPECEHPEH
jgi:gluconate 2-dehydrogenase gamma chain